MMNTSSLSRRNLHLRAAEYYRTRRLPKEQWINLQAIEVILLEYDHLIKAGAYDEAFKLVDEIDNFYLSGWGYAQRVYMMREALLDKNLESRNNIQNLIGLGRVSITLGKSEEANHYLLKSLQQAQSQQLKFEEGIILANLAQASFDLGEYKNSIEYYKTSIEITREEPRDLRGEAARLCGLAVVYREEGELNASLAALNDGMQAAGLLAPIGRSILGTLKKNLGDIYQLLGKYELAEQAYEEAFSISKESIRWNRRAQHEALTGMALVLEDRGRLDKAVVCIREALEVAVEIRERDSEGYKKRDLGRLLFSLGNLEEGLNFLIEALDIASALHIPRLKHYAACDLGLAYLVQGQLELASQMIEKAQEFIVPRNATSFHTLAGIVFARLGVSDQALLSFQVAISSAEAILNRVPDYWSARLSLAIASAGKMLLEGEENNTLSEKTLLKNFESAMQYCSQRGISSRLKILFDNLVILDKLRLLSSCEALLAAHW
jgi:tetratricopeptide (TPR) repeat protein